MKSRLPGGFALPTVMITSVIMLMVMLSAVTSTVAVRVSLDAQYYNQLSKTAGDAGIAYAKACLAANSGTPQWSDAKPLMPNTDCKGDQLVGFTCPANSVDPRCSIGVVDSNIVVSFSVPAPLPDTSGAFTNITASGSVTFLRSSDGGVWRQYKNTVKASKSPLSGIGNGIASSPEVTWKQSESGYWKQISAGAHYNCAIASNDQVYCWGLNNNGQLGNGTTTQSSVPVAVSTSGVFNGLTIKSVSAGFSHTCAIASNDKVYCWGYDEYGYGVLGNNTTSSSSIPVAVNVAGTPLANLTIKQVSAGSNHTCVIALDEKVYCWGRNTEGQLGNNTTIQSNIPVTVSSSGVLNGLAIKTLDSGQTHTCAIASDDRLYCWGYNGYGQFGNNTGTNSSVPVASANTGVLTGKFIKSIDVGQNYSCVIAFDDKVYCSGNNNSKQLGNGLTSDSLVPVAVMTSGVLNGLTIKSINAKVFHTCVIASDDKPYCWGHGVGGQLGNNLTDYSSDPVAVNTAGVLNSLLVKSIVAGYYHTCAIASNNQTYCWGGNSTGAIGDNSTTQRNTPVSIADGAFNSTATSTLTAGDDYHSCAIATNNQAYCWGYNYYGGLGNGTTADSYTPTPVDMSGPLNGLTIKSISAGYMYTCAIASNDQVYCWGYNNYGQLGNNSTTNSNVPVAVNTTGVLNGLKIKSISMGYSHSCAVASNNQVYCWGAGVYGQLGNNSGTDSSVPVAVTTSGALNGLTVKSAVSGYMHVCVIASNNQVYCWGDNGDGRLGNNSTVSAYAPVAVTNSGTLSGLTIKSITAGYYHTCAIASNDKPYCWGKSNYGQLGNNNNNTSTTPVAVIMSGALNGLTVKSISNGAFHTCAIASDDKAYCWGYNADYGQLGNNSTVNSSLPVAVNTSGVLNGLAIKQISGGYYHTCAMASNNQLYCWGANGHGVLGNNSTTNSLVPVTVSTAGILENPTFNPISAGFDHTCIVAVDKKAYCWGNNTYGQLGNNSTTQSNVPVPVDMTGVLSGLTIKTVSAGQYITCVVASNDKAYCWGRNYYGQLGNNLTADSHVPVAVYTSGVLSGLTVKSIGAGYYHACVIASNNQAYCWGYNLQGQLGNSSNTDSHVPVAVYTGGALNGLSIKSISAGSMHNCVVASNNLSYCWGFNNSGQMGNDTGSDYSYPVAPMTTGVLSGLTIKSISAGLVHTCAVASNNQVYCWGDNYNGQLGDGTSTIRYRPVATYTGGALNGLTVKYVSSSAGGVYTCAIASNNKLYCWGKNDFGQLGNNTINTSYEPIAVIATGALNNLTVKSISSGAYHACVVASNNQPYCWGQNTYGQLGNNTTVESHIPASVYSVSGPGWFSY